MAKKIKTRSSGAPSAASQDLDRLQKICDLMEKYELGELDWEKDGEKLRLRSKGAMSGTTTYVSAPQQMSVPPVIHQAPPVGHVTAAGVEKPGLAANQKQITSPFVGTFYRSASPTADVYVKEGQSFKRGDALCIIEAMKLMNEIEAEISGKVIQILAENGQPVEYGEPLFLVEV